MAPGVCYGRSDLALAEDAAACAAALHLPSGLPVYASPLRRCRELALALSPQAIVDERLIEMDFGTWELCAWDAIPRDEIDAWSRAPLDYAPPGGEPVSALRARVRGFLADHRGDGEIALVTHAGVMKLIAAELLGLPQAQWLALRFDYGAAFSLEN